MKAVAGSTGNSCVSFDSLPFSIARYCDLLIPTSSGEYWSELERFSPPVDSLKARVEAAPDAVRQALMSNQSQDRELSD